MSRKQEDFDWSKWIKRERRRRALTQQQLANAIGTTACTVSRWERGYEVPHPSSQEHLTAFFKGQTLPSSHDIVEKGPLHPGRIYDTAIPPLPALDTGLIGRGDLIRHVRSLLRTHSGPFVLKGMFGVGKTALASELAHDHELQKSFPEGILWAALGRHPSPLRLLSRWGALLGMTSAEVAKLTTIPDWQEALRDTLGQRRFLIIIDDAWEPEDALIFKLGGLNCVQLLTTRFQEVALAFTRDTKRIVSLSELSTEESVKLLETLAPEIAKKPEDARELAQLVGGLPLALTIMGRHIQMQGSCNQVRRVMTAIELLHEAEKRLRLTLLQPLSERPPNLAAGIPLSLYATIEVSTQQLSDPARSALYALSVFPAKPNSFSESAALHLGATSGENLDELVDTGLLESCGQDRYTLHQVIADYAKLQMKTAPLRAEKSAAEERMVTFFTSFVSMHATDYDLLEQELRNILASFHLACEKELIEVLVQGMNAFAPFLEARGISALVESYVQRARTSAETWNRVDLKAMLYLHLGRIAQLNKELQQAEQYYQSGLQAARLSQNRQMIGIIQARWGEVIVHSGEYIRAEEHLQEGLATIQELGGEPRMMSILLRNLGEVASCRGDGQGANEFYEQGLRLARQINDCEIMSTLLQNLGVMAERGGEYEKAGRYYREGLDCAHKAKHQQRISAMLMNMGMLAFKQQRYNEAKKLYLESLAIARKIQVFVRISSVLQNLGMLERVRGNYGQAALYLQESLDIAYQIGHAWLISETLYEWGELYLQQADVAEAAEAFDKAFKRACEIQARELIAAAAYGISRVEWRNGNHRQARFWGEKSLVEYQDTGNEALRAVEEWVQTLNV